MELHAAWMRRALELADKGSAIGEVPVGCIIVGGEAGAERILGEGTNSRESAQDPTGHAEMAAIRASAKTLGAWRLEKTTAYVTLEPCAMCAGALVLARVERVVFGALDPKAGAVISSFGIGRDGRLNHQFEVVGGVLAEECGGKLSTFFAALRAQGKK
ncbi:MAG: tRNA adenosine(34) deaminase TadA [Polyangiaceae bacterium]|nr:tRNA adenosine(34) deaminase TadA [Polyangiaceae bacterium]